MSQWAKRRGCAVGKQCERLVLGERVAYNLIKCNRSVKLLHEENTKAYISNCYTRIGWSRSIFRGFGRNIKRHHFTAATRPVRLDIHQQVSGFALLDFAANRAT